MPGSYKDDAAKGSLYEGSGLQFLYQGHRADHGDQETAEAACQYEAEDEHVIYAEKVIVRIVRRIALTGDGGPDLKERLKDKDCADSCGDAESQMYLSPEPVEPVQNRLAVFITAEPTGHDHETDDAGNGKNGQNYCDDGIFSYKVSLHVLVVESDAPETVINVAVYIFLVYA